MSPNWEALRGVGSVGVPDSQDTPVPTEQELGASPQQLCCAGALTSSAAEFLITIICQMLFQRLPRPGGHGVIRAARLPREPRANGATALCVAAATASWEHKELEHFPRRQEGHFEGCSQLITAGGCWAGSAGMGMAAGASRAAPAGCARPHQCHQPPTS